MDDEPSNPPDVTKLTDAQRSELLRLLREDREKELKRERLKDGAAEVAGVPRVRVYLA